MGSVLRALTRRNLIAVAVGVLLAGVPLLAFDLWLDGLIDRQGQADVDTSAKRTIAIAESRVAQVVGALDALAAQGVGSCGDGQVELMRHAAFDTAPIKEVAVVGADGHTLCTDLGLPLGERTVLASEPLTDSDGYMLDILRLGSGEHMVRLRRKADIGPNDLAALVPAALFLPLVSNRGGPFSAQATMLTRQGAVIGTGGSQASGPARFVSRLVSDKYGFTAEVALPPGQLTSGQQDFQRLSMVATGGGVLIVIVFALLLPRRRATDNPVAEMERALEAGEFIPYYQPIVDIRSGQLRGAEVLVRWRKPDGTLVLPGTFIPLAESSGLILDMTRDLMRRVCAEAGTVLGRRPGLKISFNFAGKLFADEGIVKDVRNIFSGSPIALSQVVLEVTERDPIENLTETRRIIAALQGIGVRIAIDDVGTGHSGLSYMLKLGVDIIKIDKMFVDAIGTDRNSTTIVETLVDLAHNMRMDVVAEGVENFEQVVHLRELGIRSAQGYVFAPPLPGSAFLQLVEAIDPLPPAVVEEKVAGAARRYISARSRFGAA
jgi:sensor c-di-GMP phosphodiesterase-like protein